MSVQDEHAELARRLQCEQLGSSTETVDAAERDAHESCRERLLRWRDTPVGDFSGAWRIRNSGVATTSGCTTEELDDVFDCAVFEEAETGAISTSGVGGVKLRRTGLLIETLSTLVALLAFLMALFAFALLTASVRGLEE